MKRWIFVLVLIFFGIEAKAQKLGDVARAERLRQQELSASKVIKEVGERKVEAPAPPPAVPEIRASKPVVDKRQAIERVLQTERLDLLKQRSALLIKLGKVSKDPKAVQEIEDGLAEIQRRAAELKVERVMKLEEHSK